MRHDSGVARSVANISLAQRHKALFIVSSQTSWLQTHLDRLRSRPAHGNRRLHLDQLFHGLLLLLAFFDPLARSLRRIEDARDFGGRIELN